VVDQLLGDVAERPLLLLVVGKAQSVHSEQDGARLHGCGERERESERERWEPVSFCWRRSVRSNVVRRTSHTTVRAT
jgi:hypothetical protein